MQLLVFLLVIFGAGSITASIYGIIANLRKEPKLTTAFVFSLILFVIMQTGLYFFRDMYAFSTVLVAFNSVSFTIQYALLSSFIGLIVSIIIGLIRRILKLLNFPFFV